MADYLKRARSAVQDLLRGKRESSTSDRPVERPDVPSTPAIEVGRNLVVGPDGVRFLDRAAAAATPEAWLDLVEHAVINNLAIAPEAGEVLAQLAARSEPSTAATEAERDRFLTLLRPRAGLASRLAELQQTGILGRELPESIWSRENRNAQSHALASIDRLAQLLTEVSLIGERFGTMLREIGAPELLVLGLLLHDEAATKDNPQAGARAAQPTFDHLQLPTSSRRTVEFLIAHQLDMAMMTLRQDTGDPGVINTFATQFSTEELLKMLTLVTIADLGAMGHATLTPWRGELLWRLFVDTYNHMTMAYGDDVIDSHEAALTSLKANRPHDISDLEMATFLEGLPRRYLTLFEPENIYQHVRLWRNIAPDDVHFFLAKKGDIWELTVVTLDKPYLFSNICGVLAYLDLDILRGYALTSRTSLVLDVFQFTDHKGCVQRPELDPLLSDVVAGRLDITAMLAEKRNSIALPAQPRTQPVIYFDQDASQRYTILELVAEDAPGLLHRISRVISSHGCAVDLVLISTEGSRAIDVFHMRKGAAKLTDADELALTEDFERMLEDVPQSST